MTTVPRLRPGGIVALTFSHLGICVSDLERSLRFYRDGLGFEPVATHRVGEEFGGLMELEGVRLESQMMARDGVTIELLAFEHPRAVGDGRRRPLNHLGLTHLSLRVDDIDAVARQIELLGGEVVRATRTHLGAASSPLDFVYCTDPDGVRIELMDLPG
ncbi:MAG TPA: VOC family protein [Acidimicrobiales bacterium]|nr:VOC family protein [Acidimicrobiales bacterium]